MSRPNNHRSQLARSFLLFLLLLTGLNAIAGAYYGLSGAPGVPLEWLQGSPFQNYFFPSLILLFCVGGSCLLAAWMVWKRQRLYPSISGAAGLILLVWIAVQMSIIGFVSWLQPFMAVVAAAILALSLSLRANPN